MKKLVVAVAFLAIAGVLFAQEAPKAEKPEAAAPESAASMGNEMKAPSEAAAPKSAAPAGEMKAAPATTEGDFCAKVKKEEGKETLGKCHKKGCKFFPKGKLKCFPSADAAKAAGVTSFCKLCCPDLQ